MMKRLMAAVMSVAAVLVFAGVSLAGSDVINGAGASFPYPIYAQWAYKYGELKGAKINYQSIGSGGGIAQIKAKTVDFGASDAPLKADELKASGLVQFPMVVGGVVPVVNVDGVAPGKLMLAPAVLADIFMGKITKWDDARIKADNPGLKLPTKSITVVHRADGSGTTWIFTDYLSRVSKGWKEKVGADKAVSWPTGVGGKGNEGVAAYVKRVKGSIGYVEYAYALQNKLVHIQLKNKAGSFVEPTIESFQAAAASADWKNAPGFFMVLNDQPGKESWPITGATFILMHKKQDNAAKAAAILAYLDWCYRQGGDMAKKLHYVPMPDNVVGLVEASWKKDISAGGKPVWK